LCSISNKYHYTATLLLADSSPIDIWLPLEEIVAADHDGDGSF